MEGQETSPLLTHHPARRRVNLQGKAPIHLVTALTARLGAEQFFEDNTEEIKTTALQHGEHSTWHQGSDKSRLPEQRGKAKGKAPHSTMLPGPMST